ncbi:MAG: hypothetical protein QM804_13280 [Propionicimonas sp.]
MGSLTWLSRGDVAGLACPYCGRTANPDDPALIAAEQAWGFVGAALTGHGERTAALLLTPVPETRDALLSCLWVAPGRVEQGRGKRLIQATAAGLLSREVESILARGSRTKLDCLAPPADFLRAVGFTRTPDERSPLRSPRSAQRPPVADLDGTRLWRLDLNATVTAPQGLRGLVEHWLRALRPIGPEPAGRVSRES